MFLGGPHRSVKTVRMIGRWSVRTVISAVVGIVVAASASPLWAAEPAAEIAELLGKVEARAGETVRTLRFGDSVYEGERIKTAVGAKAKLLFSDRSVITIGPDTDLLISRSLYRTGNKPQRESLFEVGKGFVRALVSRWSFGTASRFEIRTPAAVAGVRGTEFIVAVDEDGKTEIHVIDGQVEVLNVRDRQNRFVQVGAGQFSLVGVNRLPSSPRASVLERLRSLLNSVDIDAIESLNAPAEPGAGDDGAAPEDTVDQALGDEESSDAEEYGPPLEEDGGLPGADRGLELGTTLPQDITPSRVRLGVDFAQ